MNALAGTLLAACLAMFATAAAGQSTTNSTEGKLAYVSGLAGVGPAAAAGGCHWRQQRGDCLLPAADWHAACRCTIC